MKTSKYRNESSETIRFTDAAKNDVILAPGEVCEIADSPYISGLEKMGIVSKVLEKKPAKNEGDKI